MDVDNQSLNAELISNWGLLRKVGTYLTWVVYGVALAMFALFIGEIAFKADDFVAITFDYSGYWILIHDSELYVLLQPSRHMAFVDYECECN